jgi:hypothetical protein
MNRGFLGEARPLKCGSVLQLSIELLKNRHSEPFKSGIEQPPISEGALRARNFCALGETAVLPGRF